MWGMYFNHVQWPGRTLKYNPLSWLKQWEFEVNFLCVRRSWRLRGRGWVCLRSMITCWPSCPTPTPGRPRPSLGHEHGHSYDGHLSLLSRIKYLACACPHLYWTIWSEHWHWQVLWSWIMYLIWCSLPCQMLWLLEPFSKLKQRSLDPLQDCAIIHTCYKNHNMIHNHHIL